MSYIEAFFVPNEGHIKVKIHLNVLQNYYGRQIGKYAASSWLSSYFDKQLRFSDILKNNMK